MHRLEAAASLAEQKAAAEMTVRGKGREPMRNIDLSVFRQFKKDCPAEAATLDEKLLDYAGAGLPQQSVRI